MSEENVEIVRRAFGVVTIPGDSEAMIAASHPGFEMHLIGVGGEPVTYVGESGIREFFRDVAQSWESFQFKATEIRDLGDRVLVLGDVRGCGRVSGVEVNDLQFEVHTFRDGRCVHKVDFRERAEALEAAGLSE